MPNWIIRIGDGKHFFNSKENVWGFNSRNKEFIKNVKENDKLFFVRRNTKCSISAFAIFKSLRYRSDKTPTNYYYNWIYHKPDDNGRWKNSKWDIEMNYINYYDLRNITNINLKTNINTKNPNGIMPISIINNINFDFENIITYVQNNNIYDFIEKMNIFNI